ncbi:MAG: hypothetical protein ACTHQE_05950 [Thermomicrobiales bacterium]|jgi:antitoxin Phd
MASHAVKPAPSTPLPEESLPSLAEVLDRVASDGPQIITRGEERFIVLGAQDFVANANAGKRKYRDFKDFLFNGPRFDGIEIEREPWTMRDIDL